MQREDRAVLMAMLMCAVSLLLIFLMNTSWTEQSNYEDVPLEPGNTVTVHGEVLEIRETLTGGHAVMKLLLPSGLMNVFVPSNAGAKEVIGMVSPGMKITVTGFVELYGGEKEIVIDDYADVVVIS